MEILKKYLRLIFLISILIYFFGVNSYAQTVYDWTGATSNDWTIASNWQVGGVTATVYPGQTSSTDIADFGVNYGYSTHFQPSLLSGSITIGSLNMGDNKIPVVPSGAPNPTYSIVLTINGALNISGAFLQMHSTGGTAGTGSTYYGRAISNRLAGSGTMTCGSFTLGDSTVPLASGVVNTTQFKIGGGSALIVNDLGDFTLYSPASKDGSNNIISINDPELSFASGTLNVSGQIKVTNVSTPFIASGNFAPLDFFSMDLFNNADSPVLNLYNANPVSIQTGGVQNSVDFYQVVSAGGTGTATVNFAGTGAAQEILVYNATAGTIYNYIDHTPSVYQNVTFSGAGTKSVTPSSGTFSVAGNFTLAVGTETVDVSTNNPVLTIAGNYSSASGTTLLKSNGTNLTISGTTSNGGLFTHSGSGNVIFTGAFTNTGTYNQSASGTVTANNTATNSGTYNQSGTGSATFNGAFNSTAAGIYNHSGSGAFTAAGTTGNGGTFNQSSPTLATFTGAVTNTGSINQTSTGNILFSAAFNNSGSASVLSQTGGGTANFPATASNDGTIIQNSTGIFNFNSTFTNALSGSLFTLTAGTTNFTNSYTNNGTFTQTGGTVNINQTGTTQSLVDNSAGGTTFSNVNVENGNTVNMSGTGQFYVSDVGVLTMSNATILAANGLLTVSSDINGTGTIANIPSTCVINGNVTVQRYITGGSSGSRGYRLLSSAVSAGSDGFGNKIYSINYLLNSTYISGTGFPNTSNSKNGNPSLYLFRENLAPLYTTFLNSNYIGIADYSASPTYGMNDTMYPTANIPIGNGYLFYFRGGPATVNPFVSGSIAQPAALASKGALNQGDVNFADWYTPNTTTLGWTTASGDPTIEGFNLVGNPYPSSIDWDKADSTSTGAAIYTPHVGPFIYMLVPGGAAGAGTYGVYGRGTGFTTNGANHIIPSGLGFFVIAGTTGPATLKFTEAAKVTVQPPALFLAKLPSFAKLPPVVKTPPQTLDLQMKLDSINSDEIIINFDPNTKTSYNMMEDARYKTGAGKVSLSSLSSDKIPLAINQLPLALKGDTIKLKVGATASGTYTLNLKSMTGIPNLYSIWLKDAFTKDSVNLRTTASYSFTINSADTTTFGSNRFTLALVQDPALAYKLLSFDANKTGLDNRQVQLTWKTQNEQNSTHFTVERSNNKGKTFDAIASIGSSGVGSYISFDKNPFKGNNLYRLKQVDLNNTITYSDMVDIQFNGNNGIAGHLNCYPNPAFNNINLSFDPKSQGHTTYNVKVTNSSGMIVRYAVITEPNWQANISNLLTGTYLVQVTDKKDNSVVGQAKFVKL